MGSRRKAREALLKAFYMSESRGLTIDEALAEMKTLARDLRFEIDDPDLLSLKPFTFNLDDSQYEFALFLGRKIEGSKDLLNDHIKSVLENWDISRLSRIDRIILWMSLAELSFRNDIPPSVSMNEAIELAKKYSSHKSPGFINGILDSVARKMGIIV